VVEVGFVFGDTSEVKRYQISGHVTALPSNRRLPDAVPRLVDHLRFLSASVPAGSVAPSMVREARP